MDAVAATEDACGMARPWSLGLDKYTGIADENESTKKKLKHKGNACIRISMPLRPELAPLQSQEQL